MARINFTGPPPTPHDPLFQIDIEGGLLTLYWSGGLPYSIELSRIQQHVDLLRWIHHIGKKGWRHGTARNIACLIQALAELRGWDLYTGAPASRESTSDEERAKLKPQLRYRVMKRDGFRCRCCGLGPEQGAVLQIDHIVAIANGGRTEYRNLQTLCSMCNLGKRDT